MHRNLYIYCLLALIVFCIGACNYLPRSAKLPMPSLPDLNNGRYKTLVIFLPGMGDSMDDFKQQGFFQEARSAKLPIDMVAADAHFAYYRKEILKERLYADIIKPAIVKGYDKIWIAGISMGGFGSFMIAQEYPEIITGVIAVAPWMAGEDMVNEVINAGGIEYWTVDRGYKHGDDYKQDLWLWLKGYSSEPLSRPPLYLLYGKQDNLNPGHKVLSKVLPAERIFSVEGGHKWEVWKKLWKQLLSDSSFKKTLQE